jgi:hypothetical protein
MFGAGKNMHRVYGVVFYLAAIFVLYGRQEILPKPVIKHYADSKLKEAKRDPKVALSFATNIKADLTTGQGKSMYEAAAILKA